MKAILFFGGGLVAGYYLFNYVFNNPAATSTSSTTTSTGIAQTASPSVMPVVAQSTNVANQTTV